MWRLIYTSPCPGHMLTHLPVVLRQCYCDNYVNSIATQEPDSDCNMACTGKPDQPCGGPNRINLFWNGEVRSCDNERVCRIPADT